MRKRNRDYVTLAVDGSFDRVDSVGCATPKEEPSSAAVVYQPMSIREGCDIPSLNACGSEVRALVVARYRTARAVVPAQSRPDHSVPFQVVPHAWFTVAAPPQRP